MTVFVPARAHEVCKVDGVFVTSTFCLCKDAIQYLNVSTPTEPDRSNSAN